MDKDHKTIDPQDPKSQVTSGDDQERGAKGRRGLLRKLFRRVGRRAMWSDVTIKECIVDISW